MYGCYERHPDVSYKLNYVFRNLSLCRLFQQQSLYNWKMELIFRLDEEEGRKRPPPPDYAQYSVTPLINEDVRSPVVVDQRSHRRYSATHWSWRGFHNNPYNG